MVIWRGGDQAKGELSYWGRGMGEWNSWQVYSSIGQNAVGEILGLSKLSSKIIRGSVFSVSREPLEIRGANKESWV